MSGSSDENAALMASAGEGSRQKRKKAPDWSRFGLSADQQEAGGAKKYTHADVEDGYQQADDGKQNELYREDQSLSPQKPWYKANFFISEPVLFGTWDGVFTSCMINILGVIIFLRMGWIVGNAGIGLTILTIFVAVMIVLIVALSAIGVCERCKMESGGVYFLLSHVLGARIGGSIGVIYCFAQSVSCSLSVMGFGESIEQLADLDNPWVAKGIAVGLVLLLLGINVAGVKWVIRLQLVLLMGLFLSAMDLIVGSFLHTDAEHGVRGYSEFNLRNNSGPDYQEGENFFTILGLFFSTVTGILAGINMSGDLRDPFHNIPNGTLASLGVATILYISFTLVLGATCVRTVLIDDVMIAKEVAFVGYLWLVGLYISSVSSCMGSLYGPPRILQSIANENVIPIIRVLGQGRGPNKVPIYSLILVTLVVLLFICVGDVNTLAPIVTTAFMMTYAAINYSYFALAMTYEKRQERERNLNVTPTNSKKVQNVVSRGEISNGTITSSYGSTGTHLEGQRPKDSFEKFASDLDKLFPERMTQRGQHHLLRQGSVGSGSTATTPEADFDATKKSKSHDTFSEQSDTSSLLPEKSATGAENAAEPPKKPRSTEITKMPRSWYSFFCNRWLALFGTFVCFFIMFSIQWGYGLAELTAALIVYVYIGQASPGYFPGIADFNFYEWVKEGVQRCCRRGKPVQEEIVVAPSTPAVHTMAAQLTEDNEDFANRGRYHQSEVVRGENFDDYDSD
ncbi:solute carrier family 12 member 8-like [Argopecten irradians]|uniref:solute carrier family 12 member 8-like n=1 Tax=Argopecten irradians TaxID=31199 RepID=UPI00372207DC